MVRRLFIMISLLILGHSYAHEVSEALQTGDGKHPVEVFSKEGAKKYALLSAVCSASPGKTSFFPLHEVYSFQLAPSYHSKICFYSDALKACAVRNENANDRAKIERLLSKIDISDSQWVWKNSPEKEGVPSTFESFLRAPYRPIPPPNPTDFIYRYHLTSTGRHDYKPGWENATEECLRLDEVVAGLGVSTVSDRAFRVSQYRNFASRRAEVMATILVDQLRQWKAKGEYEKSLTKLLEASIRLEHHVTEMDRLSGEEEDLLRADFHNSRFRDTRLKEVREKAEELEYESLGLMRVALTSYFAINEDWLWAFANAKAPEREAFYDETAKKFRDLPLIDSYAETEKPISVPSSERKW